MEPNTNQQGPGMPGQPSGQPQDDWRPQSGPIPDWQQGLGTGSMPPLYPTTQQPQWQQPQPAYVPPETQYQSYQPQYGVGQVSGVPAPPLVPAPRDAGVPLPNPGNDNPAPAIAPAPRPNPVPAPQPLSPPGVRDSSMGPNGPQPLSPQAPRRLPIILFVSAVVIIALIAAIVYVALRGKGGHDTAGNPGTSQNAQKAVDLATVNTMSFGLPNDLNMFMGDSSTEAKYHVYLTQGSTDDKACSLEFGVATPDQLPGDDIDKIINPQLDALKKAGATVTGPKTGAALVLKDFSNSKKTYRLPTRDYQFTKDAKHVIVHYSLVILKSGNRAFVSRQCLNANGEADAATLAKVETAAKQITINKQ